MKFEDDRHSEMRSQISPGDSLVLAARVSSFSSISFISFVASIMGTDGKSVVASKDTIFSFWAGVGPFICSTNWVEFLHTRGLFSMKGLRMQ